MDLEKYDVRYSSKVIGPYPEKLYNSDSLNRVNDVIKRMRWKLFWAKEEKKKSQSKNQDQNVMNTEEEERRNSDYERPSNDFFGFKSTKYPKFQLEMKNFEEEFISKVINTKRRKVSNEVQDYVKLKRKGLKQTEKIIIKADKTDNYYSMSCELYNRKLKENITAKYRRGNFEIVKQINDEARELADRLGMSDRIQKLGRQECYITLKDHKENFPARIDCRLINPSKTEMGRVSKTILQRIVQEVRASTGLNQWRNTQEALTWFNGLGDTSNAKFIQADVEAFYPSISKELLLKALNWARSHSYISDLSMAIIIHCRRGVLWHEGQVWVKKDDQSFDVSMGSFDGAECCDVVGLYLLHQATETHAVLRKEDVGLFRDDLAGVTRGGGPVAERKKKELIKVFKSEGLNITADCNLASIDFLDVTLTIKNQEHKPYMKKNSKLQYLDVRSNHPPIIKKSIASGVEKRLSTIFSSKKVFNEDIRSYQEALDKADHKHKLTFQETPNEEVSDTGGHRIRIRSSVNSSRCTFSTH